MAKKQISFHVTRDEALMIDKIIDRAEKRYPTIKPDGSTYGHIRMYR